jgi:hypothetical protein
LAPLSYQKAMRRMATTSGAATETTAQK